MRKTSYVSIQSLYNKLALLLTEGETNEVRKPPQRQKAGGERPNKSNEPRSQTHEVGLRPKRTHRMSSLTDKSYVRGCITGHQGVAKPSTWELASMGLRSTLRHSLPSSRRHSWILVMLWHLRIPTLLRIPIHGSGGIVPMSDRRTLHGRSIRGTLINHTHSTAASLHCESGTGDLSIRTTCFATMGLMGLSCSTLGASAIWMNGVVGPMGRKGRSSSCAGVTWSTMMRSVALLRTRVRELRWRLHINSRRRGRWLGAIIAPTRTFFVALVILIVTTLIGWIDA